MGTHSSTTHHHGCKSDLGGFVCGRIRSCGSPALSGEVEICCVLLGSERQRKPGCVQRDHQPHPIHRQSRGRGSRSGCCRRGCCCCCCCRGRGRSFGSDRGREARGCRGRGSCCCSRGREATKDCCCQRCCRRRC